MIERIRDAVKKCLQLPPHANMEYKPHQASIQDRSSFRNTSAWNKSKSVTDAGVVHQRSTSVGVMNIGAASPHEPATTTLAGASSSSVASGADSEHSGAGGPMSRRSNSWGEERKPAKRSDGPRWRPT